MRLSWQLFMFKCDLCIFVCLIWGLFWSIVLEHHIEGRVYLKGYRAKRAQNANRHEEELFYFNRLKLIDDPGPILSGVRCRC